MFGFLKKLLGTKSEKDIKDIEPIVDQINEIFATLSSISNDELRNRSKKLKDQVQENIKEENAQIAAIRAKMEADKEMDINAKEELYKEIDEIEEGITKKIEETLNEILPEAFAVLKNRASL